MFLVGLIVGLVIGVIALFIMKEFCRKTAKVLKFYFAICFVLGCTSLGFISDINDDIDEKYAEIYENVINEINAQIETQKAADKEQSDTIWNGITGAATILDSLGGGGLFSLSASLFKSALGALSSDNDNYSITDVVPESDIIAEIDRRLSATGLLEDLELAQSLRTIFFLMTVNCVIFIVLVELGFSLNQPNREISKRMKKILIASVVLKLILCIIFSPIFLFDFGFAFVSATLAKRKKGLDFWTWYVYGTWLGIVAIIHILYVLRHGEKSMMSDKEFKIAKARNLLNDGHYTAEEISQLLNVPIESFTEKTISDSLAET